MWCVQPPAWQDGKVDIVPRTKNRATAKYTILVHILIGDDDIYEDENIVTYGCIYLIYKGTTNFIYL
jgi:hypothetical protein